MTAERSSEPGISLARIRGVAAWVILGMVLAMLFPPTLVRATSDGFYFLFGLPSTARVDWNRLLLECALLAAAGLAAVLVRIPRIRRRAARTSANAAPSAMANPAQPSAATHARKQKPASRSLRARALSTLATFVLACVPLVGAGLIMGPMLYKIGVSSGRDAGYEEGYAAGSKPGGVMVSQTPPVLDSLILQTFAELWNNGYTSGRTLGYAEGNQAGVGSQVASAAPVSDQLDAAINWTFALDAATAAAERVRREYAARMQGSTQPATGPNHP